MRVIEVETPPEVCSEERKVRLVVVLGTEREGYPELVETSEMVEREAGAALAEVPGAHVGYFDHAREMAEAVRPIFDSVNLNRVGFSDA